MDKNTSENETENRSGNDRRHLSFTVHLPERRSGEERRKDMKKLVEIRNRQLQIVEKEEKD